MGNLESYAPLLEDLCRFGFKLEVCKYLDSVFANGWAIPSDGEYHALRMLAFKTKPERYYPEVLDSLRNQADWSKQLLLATIGFHGDPIFAAILSCSPDAIASFFIWLEEMFPPEDEPSHDGVMSYNSVNGIYEMKSHIITSLSRNGADGSEQALIKSKKRFPRKEVVTELRS